MSSLAGAYRSLYDAKEEKRELKVKLDRLDEVYNVLIQYCRGFNYAKYRTIREQIETYNDDNRDKRLNILFLTLGYFFGLAFADFVSVFLAGNIEGVVASIFAFIVLVPISTAGFFKAISNNKKKIRELRNIENSLGKDTKYTTKSIRQLLDLIVEAKGILQEDIDTISDAIKEYEEALNKVNENLAEEILSDSGIAASVTMNASMKTLEKRYEQNK